MSIFTSLLTAGSNSHQETSENFNALATDFITPGVIGAITNTAGVAPATGAFAINAQGTPNMTVAVSSGIAWATATPSSQNSQNLRIRNTASSNVTISANSSGSTKFDWVYLAVSATVAANPAIDASDVTTLVVSRSSSSTADNGTPPAFGLNLGVVTVANGASSITNGNIADKRVLASSSPLGSIKAPSIGTDSSWSWTTWTPTLANITIGNGTVLAKYSQIGKTVRFRMQITFGSTSAMGSTPTFSLPLPAAPDYGVGSSGGHNIGVAEYLQPAVQSNIGGIRLSSTTVGELIAYGAASTYVGTTGMSSGLPFTWTTGNIIFLSGEYEAD